MDGGTKVFAGNETDGSPDYIANTLPPNSVFSADHVAQASQSYTCMFLASLAGMARAGVDMNAYISYRGYNDYGIA